MATNNTIIIQNWFSGVQYQTYDVIQGLNISNTSYYSPSLYFSTIDNNIGNNPSGQFVYAINSYSRSSDIATVNFTYTGNIPNYARGSLYSITGLPDPYMNATGMVLNVGSNGGSGMYLQFINPGPVTNSTSTSIGAINSPEPSFTTGFFWTPSYATPLEIQQNVITAQFDSLYVQRQPQGIASNTNIWTLNFENRSDREAKGISAFVQNMAAVYSTTILIPASNLYNNPNIKYVLSNPKNNSISYNINTISVTAKQVNEF